jgi:hypothetical protein
MVRSRDEAEGNIIGGGEKKTDYFPLEQALSVFSQISCIRYELCKNILLAITFNVILSLR